MTERWGEKEAVRRTVTNLTMSTGLELLAKYGRLDCAYEQVILDFTDEFDAVTIAKARANLARLPPSLPAQEKILPQGTSPIPMGHRSFRRTDSLPQTSTRARAWCAVVARRSTHAREANDQFIMSGEARFFELPL
jgi:hypothetical protein